ncbi:MAG: hypothetical protein PW790_04150 [Parvibaculaceae bacterium]|nr:hypothetical protein [Parvibaculaceae bacterium]
MVEVPMTGTARRSLLARLFVETRSVMPAAGSTGLSLVLVIATMCFLASLTLGAVLAVNHATQSWTRQLSGALTVEIRAVEGQDPEMQRDAALTVLSKTPGILTAKTLTRDDVAALIQPWLGADIAREDLPFPQLIDVRVDTAAPPDLVALAAALEKSAPGVKLDSHREWLDDINGAANAAQGLSYAILAIITLTTIAIVTFATRAGLLANHEIVELLHLIGARDNFIASEIQRHFLLLGLRGGVLGLALSLLAFGGMALAMNSRSFLVSMPTIQPWTLTSLLLVPVMAALVSVITARMTVMRGLGRMM